MAAELPHGKKARRGPQPLHGLAEAVLEPTLKARGFASAAIHRHWAEIAGAELAQWSEPVSLRWPPRPPGAAEDPGGAALTVKVEGAFALDLQHRAPQVVERVNGFLGWRCVERLQLKQGPVRKGARPQRRGRSDLTVDASRRLDAMLAPVEDQGLKAALARLGVGVMGKRQA
jgi:hypothetical protein